MSEHKTTRDPRKDLGWFSRRHETSEQHDEARAAWSARKDKAGEVARLAGERAARTPKQQLELLDRRLGVGQGAVKERARLAAALLGQ